MTKIPALALIIFIQIPLTTTSAEEFHVAVASNFRATLNEIVRNFKRDTKHTVLINSGSSGKFYAQITHGAPFDVFFSADVMRAQRLEEEGLAVPGSRFTYAIGRLTLWSPAPDMIKGNSPTVLSNGHFAHLAMANPKTAPYGAAAKRTLESMGLWNHVKDRIVQGENIGQAFHFVYSQNAELGFMALSQILDPKIHGAGSRWNVPENLHEPLRQQAILLIHGQHNTAAQAFLDYVKEPKARTIIKQFGYKLE